MRKLLFLATALIGLTVGATTLSKPSTWSEGIPAEGMQQLLIDIQPMAITLPASYAEHITTDTVSVHLLTSIVE